MEKETTNKKTKKMIALILLVAALSILLIFFLPITLAQYSSYQYYSPSPFQYYGKDMSTYWPGFSEETCEAGQDFIVQIAPVGCTPTIIRSDLLEEQNVPVFCRLEGFQINPLIEVPEITSIKISPKGKYPEGIVGLTFHPARAALGTGTKLVGSPFVDNLGYVVIVVKRMKEQEMPDWIEGELTALITYKIEKLYGAGQNEFWLKKLTDSEWISRYKEFSFWKGKGYIRASEIGRKIVGKEEKDFARIDVYRDAENKIASFMLEPGQTSKDVYLSGFYCAAGLKVHLEDISIPRTKARLNVDGNVIEVVEGQKIFDECTVGKIEPSVFGGSVKIYCPGKNYEISRLPPKADLIIRREGEKESPKEFTLGEKIGDDVYLAYIGNTANAHSGFGPRDRDFVVIVKFGPEGKEKITFEREKLSEKDLEIIAHGTEKMLTGKELAIGRHDIWTALRSLFRPSKVKEVKELFEKKPIANNFYELVGEKEGKIFENSITKYLRTVYGKDTEVWVYEHKGDVYYLGTSHYASWEEDDKELEVVSYKPVAPEQKKYTTEIGKLLEEYYKKAIDAYKTLERNYGSEKQFGSQIEAADFYGEIALREAEKLAEEIGKREDQEQFLLDLLDKYPGSEDFARRAMLASLRGASSAVDIETFEETYSVTLENIVQPSKEEFGVYATIDGERDLFGEGDIIEIKEKRATVVVKKIYDDYVLFEIAYKPEKDNLQEKTLKIEEGKRMSWVDVSIFVEKINIVKEAHVKIIPKLKVGETEANFTVKIAIEKRAIKLSPEQTQDLIESLNESITKWEEINEKLGNVVRGWKGTCYATQLVLWVKNFFRNLGGGSIARKEVMDIWRNHCAEEVAKGNYKTLHECYSKNSDEIDSTWKVMKENVLKETANIDDKMRIDPKGKKLNIKTEEGEEEYHENYIDKIKELRGKVEKELRKEKEIKIDPKKIIEADIPSILASLEEKEVLDEQGEPIDIADIIKRLPSERRKEYLTEEGILNKTITIVEGKINVNEALEETRLYKLAETGNLFTSDFQDTTKALLVLRECEKGELTDPKYKEFCKKYRLSVYDKLYHYGKTYEKVKKMVDKKEFQLHNTGAAVPLATTRYKEEVLEIVVYTAPAGGVKTADGKEVVKQGEQYTYVSDGHVFLATLTESFGVYGIKELYEIIDNKIQNTSFVPQYEEEKKDIAKLRGKRMRGLEVGECENKPIETEVKFFESAPYKGFAAIVPLGKYWREGWYVAVPPYNPSVTTGLRAYTEAGELQRFWICNVGSNGMIEFSSEPVGDDVYCCVEYFAPTLRDIDGRVATVPGKDKRESDNMVAMAFKVIREAGKQYGQRKIKISGAGTFDTGIKAAVPEAECEEFMSPGDCNILFNVCDPVLCPASRCNFGGRYYVDDVIQTGIIGGIVLCLPNFGTPAEGGVLVPVCLTGIHAGLDNFVTILKATRDCLQESLDTGRNVGICDEIKSIYLCEFFWRQFAPFIRIGLPRLLGFFFSGGRGGGEYLAFNDAWQRSIDSVQYITNYYGANAWKAFRARTTEEVGTDICRAFVSQRFPTEMFFDQLLEPESPVQFNAWFEEIPFTTVTVPATSHYKVYYHIYAGKDKGAYYKVYLKRKVEPGFYVAIPTVHVAAGYVKKGEYVDEARDFTAPAGYTELCIMVDAKEECGFGKVSTLYAINWLSDQYLAEQAKQEIKTEEECLAGTPSLWPLAQPSIEAGVGEAMQPALYKRGIVRVCASENPDGNTEPGRWEPVGYCDEAKKIRCWLDTDSVKGAIKDLELANQTLAEAQRLAGKIGIRGLWTEDMSLTELNKAIKLKDEAIEAVEKLLKSEIAEVSTKAETEEEKFSAKYSFDFDSYEIKETMDLAILNTELKRNLPYMKSGEKIKVDGYASDEGMEEQRGYNEKLSADRAEAIKEYIWENLKNELPEGFREEDIITNGYGTETKFSFEGKSEEEKKQIEEEIKKVQQGIKKFKEKGEEQEAKNLAEKSEVLRPNRVVVISFEIEESETYKTETVTFSESLTAKQIRNDLQDIITPTMGLLDEILSSAFLNYHKARAQYGKAEIYEEIVKGLKVIAEKYEPVPEAKKPEEAEPGWVITEKIPGEVLPLGFISKIEPLSWPIRGEYVVSSCFGYRGDIGIKGASVCHPGIDILASAGTDVLAAADGEIIQGGVEKDYILIVHDKGLATRYVHVSGRVEKGKKVKRGDIIANVKGDHLHFEVIDYQAGPRHFKEKGITEEEICLTPSDEKLKAKVVFAEPGRRAFKLWNANIINMVVSSDTVLSRTAHLNPLCFFRGEIYEEIKFTETKGIACEEETGGWLKGCELIGSI